MGNGHNFGQISMVYNALHHQSEGYAIYNINTIVLWDLQAYF